MYCFSTVSNLKSRKIFREINRQFHRFSLSIKLSIEYVQKISEGNTIACRFLQSIWFHTHRKGTANTTSIWSLSPPPQPNKTVTAIMVHSPDGNNNFNIVAGILQGYTLAPYLFIFSLDYILQTSVYLKENHFTLQEKKKKALLANIPA